LVTVAFENVSFVYQPAGTGIRYGSAAPFTAGVSVAIVVYVVPSGDNAIAHVPAIVVAVTSTATKMSLPVRFCCATPLLYDVVGSAPDVIVWKLPPAPFTSVVKTLETELRTFCVT
jgi:hypothetical protein